MVVVVVVEPPVVGGQAVGVLLVHVHPSTPLEQAWAGLYSGGTDGVVRKAGGGEVVV